MSLSVQTRWANRRCSMPFARPSSRNTAPGLSPSWALQNDRNQAAPVVELAFELDDGLYRITKRFIKKSYARLSCPDGRSLEGDAAEDALRDLLDFDEPGKTGAKPETLGMWNVLWVEQGQSFRALDLPRAPAQVFTALLNRKSALSWAAVGGARCRRPSRNSSVS